MAWTAPSTWVAAAVVTAAQLNQQLRDNLLALVDRVQVVRATTDQSITSSAVLTNDTALSFAAVAGQTYEFDIALIFSSSSSAIDAKVGFSFPAGTLSFMAFAMDPTVASGQVGSGLWVASSSATSGTTALSVGVASADTPVLVRGSFQCTTTGTVQMMWAQNTSTATAMLRKTGSVLRAHRAAV